MNNHRFIEPNWTDIIKIKPPVNYNEMNIADEYMKCALSILCKISDSYNEIQTREDGSKREEALKGGRDCY